MATDLRLGFGFGFAELTPGVFARPWAAPTAPAGCQSDACVAASRAPGPVTAVAAEVADEPQVHDSLPNETGRPGAGRPVAEEPRARPRSAVQRDAAHNEVLDLVATGLAAEARAFADRLGLLRRLAALEDEGAKAGVVQFPQLEAAGSWGIGQLTATRWADDAARYETCLPGTLELLSQGALFVHQAQVLLTRTRHCSEQVCRGVEAEVLPLAASLCPSDLRKLVDRVALRLRSAELTAAEAEQQHADRVAGRRTWTRPEVDGMATAGAVLPAEQLLAWQHGMDLLERRERAADRAAGVDRTAEQRRADLFAALPAMVLAGTAQDRGRAGSTPLDGSCPCGRTPETGCCRAARAVPGPLTAALGDDAPLVLVEPPAVPWTLTPEHLCAQIVLNVHVPVATVLDRSHEPGVLDRYGPVSAEHVRLVRPHSYRRVLVDADSGRPIAVDDRTTPAAPDARGRRAQVRAMLRPDVVVDRDEARHDPSASLARLVHVRDVHCCGPGCCSAVTDLDHLERYPDGPTSASNLGPLSRRCHRAKHHGWTLLRHVDGSVTWTSPLGRSYSRPGPHRPPPTVDLHARSPRLRPPPAAQDQQWVVGEDPPEQEDVEPVPPRDVQEDEPPF